MRYFFAVLFAASVTSSSAAFGQIVIQHLGAADPVTEGFYIDGVADVEAGPVFNDMGLDAWGIQKLHQGTYTYSYNLSLKQQEDAATHGWIISGRMRFVEPGIAAIRFGGGFFMSFYLREGGAMLISQGNVNYTFEEAGFDYHEFSVVYNVSDEQAMLWIDGSQVGAFPGTASGSFAAFGLGQGTANVHWNEFSLTIIPEPATVALLSGIGALVLVGGARWGTRRTKSITRQSIA